MGKPKNKVAGTGGGGEEARPSGADGENAAVKEEKNAEEGEVTAPVPTPVPAPRKRGRPRKVALKVEESIEVQTQQVSDAESKKQKAESPGRNGNATDAHPSTSKKFPLHVPLRREGSRRKSEPRRAAD